MRVKRLDDATINQIAAGEVVEDSASVVKELVDNAIDARAHSILVEIEKGGLKLIRVSDDGDGMDEEDARLSIERHATSKIAVADDLVGVQTMGFRGEALASIASISHFKLLTASKACGSLATQVTCSGGKSVVIANGARSKGTTIEVRQLFYNTPARLKFQKSCAASTSRIIAVLTDLALAHPDICLELRVDGQSRLFSKEMLGPEYVNQVLPVNASKNEMHIKGVIGKPHAARSSRKGQYLIVNRRAVHSPFLVKVIEQAYGTRLNGRQYPIFVLTLDLPGEGLDVNVHPQKKEVRFLDKERLSEFVHYAIQKAFAIQPTKMHVKPEKWSVPIAPSTQECFVAMEQAAELPIAHIPIIGIKSPYVFISGEGSPLSSHLKEREGIVMVDLRCIEERLLYEQIKGKASCGQMQQLAFPLTLEFSKAEAESIAHQIKQLHQLGIGLRPFGQTSFVIDRLHPSIPQEKVKEILLARADQELPLELVVSLVLQKRIYHLSEAKQLIEKLLTCCDCVTTPRGKPIFVHLDEKDIQHVFKTY
ncbi:MAG: DNA mismatch repair endonuclease MutL [Chlamydiales bacterium]|nr:DNA mismatch repair endonuclease MutL [Chlamydiales bacterium]